MTREYGSQERSFVENTMTRREHYSVRSAAPGDRAAWRALWEKYCTFYDMAITPHTTEVIWERIINPNNPTHALVAVSSDSELVGFTNYVVHFYTWSDRLLCFAVDFYVAESWRRRGVADALMSTLFDHGREQNWLKIYWNTEQTNTPARAWYDKFAQRSPYISYQSGGRSRQRKQVTVRQVADIHVVATRAVAFLQDLCHVGKTPALPS